MQNFETAITMQGKWNETLNYFPIWKTVKIPAVSTTRSGVCTIKGNNVSILTIGVPDDRKQDGWLVAMEEVHEQMKEYIAQRDPTDYGYRRLVYPFHDVPTMALLCTSFTRIVDCQGNMLQLKRGVLSNSIVNVTATCTGVWLHRNIHNQSTYEVHWDVTDIEQISIESQDQGLFSWMAFPQNSIRLHECAHLIQSVWRFKTYKHKKKQSHAASTIQRHWRDVCNSPYTAVGRRCIMQRYNEMYISYMNTN